MTEIYKEFFVPKRELETHEKIMAAGIEASKHDDVMSPEEEDEWKIAQLIREKSKNVIEK